MIQITKQTINNFLKVREHEVILFFLCLVAIAFSFINPLWFNQAPGQDASVFALIGKMWANGQVPYRDMIDIYGPGIFFIDMIGYCIGGYPGIAFIEALCLVFGVISLDLALRLFKFSPLARFCSIVVVISLLGLRYYYGNMTEDYALYFAMIASYPFAWLYYYGRFNWLIAIIPAFMFALTISMRITNGAYFIAWYLMLMAYFYANGKSLNMLKLLLSIIIGLVVVFAGFALYFSYKDESLLEKVSYYSLFVGNGSNFSAEHLAIGLVGFLRTGLWIVLAGFYILLRKYKQSLIIKDSRKDSFWFILYLSLGVFFTWVFNSLAGELHDHYDQLYLPFMFIPLAFLMHRYLHITRDITISFLTIVGLIVFLVMEHILWGWSHGVPALSEVFGHIVIDALCAAIVCLMLFIVRKKIGAYRHNHTFFLCLSIAITLVLSIYTLVLGPYLGKPKDFITQNIVDIVVENTNPGDLIWVDFDKPQYYIWTDRMPVAPTLFRSEVNPGYDVKQQVLKGIMYFKPTFVITDPEVIKAFISSDIKEKIYELSERELYTYITTNYVEVVDGLFVAKPELKKIKKSRVKADLRNHKETAKALEEAKKANIFTPREEGSLVENKNNQSTTSNTTDNNSTSTNTASAKDDIKEESSDSEVILLDNGLELTEKTESQTFTENDSPKNDEQKEQGKQEELILPLR